MLEKILKKSGWTDMILSIIFVLFGIMLIANPEAIVSFIAIILGLIFILIGVFRLSEYFSTDKTNRYLLAIGIVAIIAGIVIMNCADIISSIFRIVIAICIIYSGIMNLQTIIIWKDYKSRLWLISLILSILIIIAGIYILVNSGAILQTIGIIIVSYGVVNIIENFIFIKNVDDYLK